MIAIRKSREMLYYTRCSQIKSALICVHLWLKKYIGGYLYENIIHFFGQ